MNKERKLINVATRGLFIILLALVMGTTAYGRNIYGRVICEDGTPIPDVLVNAYKCGEPSDLLNSSPIGPVSTDAEGKYTRHITWIPDGDCLELEFIFPDGNIITEEQTATDSLIITTVDCGTCNDCGCRFTGGGVDTDLNWDHTLESGEMIRNGSGSVPEGIDRAQFGGQAGANTALPPQPAGEWTHHQQRGPSGRFTFHGGTASAPAGSEIDEIRCSDPGGCKPSGDPPSPAKQLDFDGIGTFKSIGKGKNVPTFDIPNAIATAEGKGNKAFNGTFHWFEVNIDDLGEKGGMNSGAPDSDICPSIGFGEKGGAELANCDCPDFYRITIYDGVDAADIMWFPDGTIDQASINKTDVIYEFYGYIDGGNLQIHHLTGYDN